MKKTEEERKLARKYTCWKYELKKYGLTPESYLNILNKQNNGCAICKSKDSKRNKVDGFIVDHNHRTGKVRGLLCDKCNKLLGAVNDDIEVLRRIKKYLQ